MQVKRTEDYYYQLSKQIHGRKVAASRSKVEDRISGPTSRTLELTHARPYDRDRLLTQRHQIDVDNRAILNRIMQISEGQKSHLDRYEQYSRFNSFERSFRRRNPFRSEKERAIQLQNQKLLKSLMSMHPRIGERREWQREHSKKRVYSNIYSKHRGGERKGSSRKRLSSELSQLQRKIKSNLGLEGESGFLPEIGGR